MIERRVIRQKFQNFVWNEMHNLHSLQLNILCLIAQIINTPKIAPNLTMTHEFCSTFIRNTVKQGRSLTHG